MIFSNRKGENNVKILKRITESRLPEEVQFSIVHIITQSFCHYENIQHLD